ncbi:hypothetical protein F4678DRAFT_419188 [Xylaria arbuscula]|nr:hypothetical protein F4678DRAFT_419188 [Xylaria arbuscula]
MADLMTADYIIVGGGITGCVIASRISQSAKKPKVVLLEAGSDPSGNAASKGFLTGLSLLGSDFDYSYQSEPVANTANRVHSFNLGKALGGGSDLNYGGWLQADSADYDEWAKIVGDKRWSYEGLQPWFRKTEKFYGLDMDTDEHGSDGPMYITSVSAAESGTRKYPLREPVRQAWSELGVFPNLDKETGKIAGLTEMWENARDGTGQPSNIVYPLDRVEGFTNTTVQKAAFTGSTANGVVLSDSRRIAAHKEVIICAGAYRTLQVLMRSGVGPSSVLTKYGIPIVHEASSVGENLQDHLAIYLAFRLRDPSRGYAMGRLAWKNPALFKGLSWDWVVSAPLPAEVIKKRNIDVKEHSRNLYEVITLYLAAGIPGIPLDGTHIATSTMLLLPTSRGQVSIQSDNANGS